MEDTPVFLSLFLGYGHSEIEDREAIFSVQNCVATTYADRAGGLVFTGVVSVEQFKSAFRDCVMASTPS